MSCFSGRSTFSAHENPLTRALGARTKPCLSLSESNPTRVGLSLSDAELGPLLGAGAAAYTPEPFGLVGARQAIAAQLSARGFATKAEHVMLTASTSEAYGYLFRLLCDPGDTVLVPAPSYPLFDTLAQLEGVRLVPYRLAYDGEWHLAGLDAAGAKAVIVVHPNNPTGHFCKRSELRAIARLQLPILSDEVFAEYAFAPDAARAESALEVASEVPVFRLGGLSKSLALPQLKLAWTVIAGPATFRDEATRRLAHIADAYLSPSTPVQNALPALLARGAAVRAPIVERCRTNHAALVKTLANSAASVLHVEGGWYAIVRVPEVLDEDGWVLTLLAEDDLLVQPGYFYDLGRGAHLVLSLITPETDFAEGAARLRARVDALCTS